MAAVNDTYRTAEFLVSEANGYRSRDEVAVISTPALVSGQVLGKITAGAATAAAQAGNTGNATSSAVVTGVNVQVGAYEVEFINATEYLVIDPLGKVVGNGATGAAFSTGSQLTFTITAGGTPMVAGDGFTITVAAGSGKYTAWSAAATNGSSVIAGILYSGTPASFDDTATIINASAEVVLDHLTPSDADAAVIAGLALLGIKAR